MVFFYSPIPYFEKIPQPILIIQGTLDEIIPENSYKLISNALDKGMNTQYKVALLEGGSHSMYFVGKSDFTMEEIRILLEKSKT